MDKGQSPDPYRQPLPSDLAPRRKRLRRYEIAGHLRFLTCSCAWRLPLFGNDRIKDVFAHELSRVRCKYGFRLYAWVLMPEHFHLLIWPKETQGRVVPILWDLKREVGKIVVARWRELDAPVLRRLTLPNGRVRFWLPGGGYDRNIVSFAERAEKIRYIHHNPVERGLVPRETDWAWSSARWYSGERVGLVPIDQD